MRERFLRVRCHERAHPLVKVLVQKMNEARVGVLDIADRSGVHSCTIKGWKARRNMPRLDLFVAVANAIGFDVKIVHRREPTHREGRDE